MRTKVVTWLCLVVLLLSAACFLGFRFFTTVDGPMHVLAAYLSEPANAQLHHARGFSYFPTEGSLLGQWIIRGLLLVAGPVRAHDLVAVIVVGVWVISLYAFLRAYGVRPGASFLWVAPLTFSNLLIMGLFHFMLAVAIAFLAVAWWKWNGCSIWARWGGLLLGLCLAALTHRSGLLLAATLFLPSFLQERYARGALRATSRSLGLVAGLVCLLVIAGTLLARSIGLSDPASEFRTISDGFYLRPLFLFDREEERPWISLIGVGLLVAIVAGVFGRWRLGRRILWHDATIILALLFFGVAYVGNSWKGRQFLIADRAQWMALTLLVLWLTALAAEIPARVRAVIAGTAILALPLHAIRVHKAEAYLAPLRVEHEALLEGGAALEPGGLVLCVLTGGDRMLQHHTAYLAMRYTGVLISPRDQLPILEPGSWKTQRRFRRLFRDPHWVMRHWRERLPTEVDQLLFVGRNVERTIASHPWPTLLGGHFEAMFTNERAVVFARQLHGDGRK